MGATPGKGTSKANQRQNRAHKGGYTKYRNEFRREKNKLRRLRRHLLVHAGDKTAHTAVDVITKAIRGYV